MNVDYKVFGERLKTLRTEKGTSQEEVAEIAGISVRQYRLYEAGQVTPPLDRVVALTYYFDVSMDYIVGLCDGEGKKTLPITKE